MGQCTCFHAGMWSLKAMLKYANRVTNSRPDLTVISRDIQEIETKRAKLSELRKRGQVRGRFTKYMYLNIPKFI